VWDPLKHGCVIICRKCEYGLLTPTMAQSHVTEIFVVCRRFHQSWNCTDIAVSNEYQSSGGLRDVGFGDASGVLSQTLGEPVDSLIYIPSKAFRRKRVITCG
jgi:hypothetical protein